MTGQVTGNREYRAPQQRGRTTCRRTGFPAGLTWYHAPDGAPAMKALLLRRLGSLESLAEPLAASPALFDLSAQGRLPF